jgi:hypothetical protein
MRSVRLCLLGVSLLAIFLAGMPAHAAFTTIGSGSFSAGATLVDFNAVTAAGTPITNQFAASGIIFSGSLFAMTNSGDLALFPGNGGGVIASNYIYGLLTRGLTFTAQLSSPANRVGFYLVNSNLQTLTVEFFNGAASIGSVLLKNTSGTTAWFKGVESDVAFDRMVFTNTSSPYAAYGFFSIDDLRFEAITAVPVPASLLLFLPGLGALIGMRRTFRK